MTEKALHVAVTGASSGIGEAIVREFSRAGARVTMVARRREKMEAIAKELTGETHIAVQDLTDLASCCSWIEGAEAAFGEIDVLVNNAGMQIVGWTHEAEIERAERLLTLNVLAPFRLTRAILPKMRARDAGTIVDIASVAALAPTPYMYHYSASKAAIAAASETLHGELRETGVHVVTVYPGIITETDMGSTGASAYVENIGMKMQPDGNTATLAALIRKAVENKDERVIYPGFNKLTRMFPGTTRWVMDRFTPKLKQAVDSDSAKVEASDDASAS